MGQALGYELQLVSGDRVLHTQRVRSRPMQIGRLPSNDLVVNDPMVSQHHALVWTDAEHVYVRDVGSRNGTRVNGKRVTTPTRLYPGDRIELGPDTSLILRRSDQAPSIELAPNYLVEDMDSGVCVPLGSDRYPILGSDGFDQVATLLLFDNGEVWLGHGTEDRPLEVDEPFEVGGRRLCLRLGDALSGATAAPVPDRYPYTLIATLNGVTGPEASLTDAGSELLHQVTADNRAILLYLLARQWAEDREKGVVLGERGWIADADVLTGIWGRDARDENKLHVLVYRLRNEFKTAGFDPWFIEKRRRYIRARLADAKVDAT